MNTQSLTGIRFNTIVRHGEAVSVRLLHLVWGRIYSRSAGIAGGIKTTGREVRDSKGKLESVSVSQLL